MATRTITTTPEQDDALALYWASDGLLHAIQPGGAGSTIYIYDADEDFMRLITITPDGSQTFERRYFAFDSGWNEETEDD
jgi:hypothetical protein